MKINLSCYNFLLEYDMALPRNCSVEKLQNYKHNGTFPVLFLIN